MKVEWRCTTMVNGVQCVTTNGIITKQILFVCNWDLDHQVYQLILDQEAEEYF